MSRLLMLVFLSGAVLSAQPQLQITSPGDGTIVNPGQSLTVTVAASGGTFAKVVLIGEYPFPGALPLVSSPYEFKIEIPSDINAGSYRLTAHGYTSPGRDVRSTSITIVVEPPPVPIPKHLRIEPDSINLFVGRMGFLHVIGVFDDDKTVDLDKSEFVNYARIDHRSHPSKRKALSPQSQVLR